MEVRYDQATASSRIFSWCGHKWFAKNSNKEKVGPGPSFFDDKNIEVGSDNSLRLWVNDIIGSGIFKKQFSSSEIQTVVPLGYGSYQVDVYGALTGSQWDSLVLGFFTYDLDDPSEHNKEIDIEIGTFNGKHASGGVFSNQNDEERGQQLMNVSPSRTSSCHRLTIEWLPKSIKWSLIDLDSNKVLSDLTSTTRVPSCEGAIFAINLWQFRDVAPNKSKQSIVLRDFVHELLQHHPVVKLNYIDNVFFKDGNHTFVPRTSYRNKQISVKAKRKMTNIALSVDLEATDVNVSYPGNKAKSHMNGDIVIIGGTSDFATMTLTFFNCSRTVLPIKIECDQFETPETFLIPIKLTD